MKKTIKKEKVTTKAKVTKPIKEVQPELSEAYLSFKAYLDKYEQERPEKFATRKEALLEKLNSLR